MIYQRISRYPIQKMVADSQYSRYTLTALAELCGFSSRASFFRSFKRVRELLRMNTSVVSAEQPKKSNFPTYYP